MTANPRVRRREERGHEWLHALAVAAPEAGDERGVFAALDDRWCAEMLAMEPVEFG
jgi:hypothetical protein